MRLGPIFFIILLSTIGAKPAHGESNEAELPPIVITPSRIPEETPLRSVSYINSGEFDRAIGSSVTDLVDELPSIDVRERGISGVQADLNIRGSTFEQSAILLNGVRFNDPQTGHHNMDIPFTTMDLGSIELVRGGNSALYGPDAFGGVVNFITKRPGERQVNTAFSMGQHGFFREAVSVTQPIKNLKNRLSFERSDSSGYRGKETSFHITTFSFDSLLEMGGNEVEVIGAIHIKISAPAPSIQAFIRKSMRRQTREPA